MAKSFETYIKCFEVVESVFNLDGFARNGNLTSLLGTSLRITQVLFKYNHTLFSLISKLTF